MNSHKRQLKRLVILRNLFRPHSHSFSLGKKSWRFAPTTVASWCGWGLVTTALSVSLVLTVYDLLYADLSPHKGVVVHLIAPVILGSGLSIVAAVWLIRLFTRAGREGWGLRQITIDLESKQHTKALTWASFLGVIFIGLMSLGGYRSFHFTESTEFCGIVCHEVMKPHYITYQKSPHAEVGCVECHVGDGAEWYIRTKLNGLREVREYLSSSYDLPIKSPLKNMRPALETCEECHWPEKFIGNREKTFTYFSRDKGNSPYSIRLLLKVGGGNGDSAKGIHWHVTGGNKIDYVPTDETRQAIPWVRVTDSQGRITEYRSQRGTTVSGDPSSEATRTMDCVDCHNRPTHVFEDPDSAINAALLSKQLDPSLPNIKQTAMSILETTYESTPVALESIEKTLRETYSSAEMPVDVSREIAVETAVTIVQKIYSENFFPETRVDWTTHPDFIGHLRWDGCFRCHDGEHVSDDGRVIPNDCNTCHLVTGQGDGYADLSELPYQVQEFVHPPDREPLGDNTRCTECHNAPPPTDYTLHKTGRKEIADAQ